MDKTETDQLEAPTTEHHKSIHFPEGLPAFEQMREFLLISNEEEAPFLWLQSVEMPNLAFLSIDPFLINSEYRPDLGDDDVRVLQIDSPDDVYIISIVNMKNDPQLGVTANLVGPVVINWKKKLGKQVILQNHQSYSVRYPINKALQEAQKKSD